MKQGNRRCRSVWLRLAFAVAVAIAAHALGGSAQAATIARAGEAPAGDAPASEPIVLAGFTSQQYPVFFKIAGDGRSLTLAGIGLNMTCTSGAQFVLADDFARLPISLSGKLHGGYTQPPTSGSTGVTSSFTDSLSGHLNRRHTQLSGTWELIAHYTFADGTTDACDSGPVRFAATN